VIEKKTFLLGHEEEMQKGLLIKTHFFRFLKNLKSNSFGYFKECKFYCKKNI